MMNNKKLTLRDTSQVLAGIAPITITRIAKSDSAFPKIEKVGRSIFIDENALYTWLSHKAGFTILATDTALTSKNLQEIFNKSHTWIWQNVKSGVLPKPFKINRSTYWMASQIEGLFQEEVA